MAVYWCDPYIDAPIGSIHGTTDTTTRSGTYSAPWTLRDLFSTKPQLQLHQQHQHHQHPHQPIVKKR